MDSAGLLIPLQALTEAIHMSANYSMTSDWYIEGDLEEIADILGDAEGYARWWSSVYLDMKVIEPGDEEKVGQVVDVYSRGWLPYTLQWRARVTESRRPFGFTVQSEGDFAGEGVWTLEQQRDNVHVRFTWNIRADKPLLRYFSFVLRPLFSANHGWAMRRGEEGLRRELARRRAVSLSAQSVSRSDA